MHSPSPNRPLSEEWRIGLCDCAGDCETCCIGCWAPCYLHAENGRRLTGDSGNRYLVDFATYTILCSLCWSFSLALCGWFGCQCFLGIERRRLIRIKYGLPEKPCSDFCVHFWCHLCALCQETRELVARETAAVPATSMVPTEQQHSGHPVPGTHPETAEYAKAF